MAEFPIGQVNFPHLVGGFYLPDKFFVFGGAPGEGRIIQTIFGLIPGLSLAQFSHFSRNLLNSVALERQVNGGFQVPKAVKTSTYSSLIGIVTITSSLNIILQFTPFLLCLKSSTV